jgi:hypothetical protein
MAHPWGNFTAVQQNRYDGKAEIPDAAPKLHKMDFQ